MGLYREFRLCINHRASTDLSVCCSTVRLSLLCPWLLGRLLSATVGCMGFRVWVDGGVTSRRSFAKATCQFWTSAISLVGTEGSAKTQQEQQDTMRGLHLIENPLHAREDSETSKARLKRHSIESCQSTTNARGTYTQLCTTQ